MSEETPQDATPETPETPETPAVPETPPTEAAPTETMAAEVPTEETPIAEAPAAAAPVAAAPIAPAPAPVAPAPAPVRAERKVVAVPMSVLVALGAIIVAVLMFGIGYAVGDSNDDNSQAVTAVPHVPIAPQTPINPQTPNVPQTPNNGNNDNGDTQTVGSGFLGVATQQTDDGLQITQVVENSAASKAGLAVNDVITEFDGDAVTTSAQLASAVAQFDVGDRVEITYTRDGQEKTVTVTLGARSTSN